MENTFYLKELFVSSPYNYNSMGQKDEIILININGADRPGVTAALSEILAKNNAVILDIGQADIHNNLSLGILFQSSEGNSGDILKELLFKSYELDVNIRFNPITEEAYNQWVSMQGKNRYIITILGRKLTARQIAGVTRIVADQDMNIDDIKRLTGRIPLDENARTPKASVEFSVRGTPRDKEQMKADFMKLSAEQEMDISFQEESMFRRMRRPDLLRYGFDADRNGSDRRIGYPGRCRRSGESHYRSGYAGRNRLLRKFPPTLRFVEGPGCFRYAGNCREPADY